MIVTLKEIKEFIRVDDDYEDNLFQSLIEIAESYLINAGCSLVDENNQPIKLAKLAVLQLVSHWYENRDIVGKADRLTFSLDNIMTQLKYCYGSD